MRHCFPIVAITLAVAFGAAGLDETSLADLHKRADSAPMGDRPALYIEIAERQLKAADELYNAGKVDDARDDVNDLVASSEKAHDAAVQSGKRLKPTEIALRKMSIKLRDIKRTLNFEDQAPVQTAAERLQSLSDDLLSHMFGKGK
jgi:polyhydroxyalkanoate synthesis regulator phasin